MLCDHCMRNSNKQVSTSPQSLHSYLSLGLTYHSPSFLRLTNIDRFLHVTPLPPPATSLLLPSIDKLWRYFKQSRTPSNPVIRPISHHTTPQSTPAPASSHSTRTPTRKSVNAPVAARTSPQKSSIYFICAGSRRRVLSVGSVWRWRMHMYMRRDVGTQGAL